VLASGSFRRKYNHNDNDNNRHPAFVVIIEPVIPGKVFYLLYSAGIWVFTCRQSSLVPEYHVPRLCPHNRRYRSALADGNEPFVACEITHAERGGVQRLEAAALDHSTIRILIALVLASPQGYMSVSRLLTAWGLLLRDFTGKVSPNVCESFSPCA
jgi:hypothetical protein